MEPQMQGNVSDVFNVVGNRRNTVVSNFRARIAAFEQIVAGSDCHMDLSASENGFEGIMVSPDILQALYHRGS